MAEPLRTDFESIDGLIDAVNQAAKPNAGIKIAKLQMKILALYTRLGLMLNGETLTDGVKVASAALGALIGKECAKSDDPETALAQCLALAEVATEQSARRNMTQGKQ